MKIINFTDKNNATETFQYKNLFSSCPIDNLKTLSFILETDRFSKNFFKT